MCAGHDRLEGFLRSLFGDLDALAEELTRHSQSVDSARQDQDAQWSRREEQLRAERQELELTFERIQGLTEQLGATAAAGSGDFEQLQAVFSGMAEERSSLQAAIEATGSQGAELTRMADDLAAARQDLAEAREELRTQRELLSQAPAQSVSATDPELRDRLDQLEQERVAWAEERAVLETELDSVRTRAAELTETLDDERQRAAGERNNWAEELRQMRRLLASLSNRSVAPEGTTDSCAPDTAEPVQQDEAQDPVLDSVMAQFEILQKDLARRRKAKPAAK
jgi:DNA repair exonuclease SbcCD ATPase subunit